MKLVIAIATFASITSGTALAQPAGTAEALPAAPVLSAPPVLPAAPAPTEPPLATCEIHSIAITETAAS